MEELMNIWKEIIEFFQIPIVHYIISVVGVIILWKISILINKKMFKLGRKQLLDRGQTNISYMAFLQHAVEALIYFVAIISIINSIPYLKSMTSTLLASTGIVAVVLGFASQEAMSNIISGVLILLFKPFVIGDMIKSIDKGVIGTIEDITLRHTVIKTLENKRVIIPNGAMGSDVIENSNFADSIVKTTFDVGISYDSDIDKAREIIVSICKNHKDFFDNRSVDDKIKNIPEIVVRVVELGDSSIDLRTWFWASSSAVAFAMKCDILESIKKEFDKQGVNIPFPHITIKN